MEQVLVVFVGFILTGVIGNKLLQSWQTRTWLQQQQFLGHEKDYALLRELAEQLSKEMGARLFHTKRLLMAIRSLSSEELEERVKKYDQSLITWNETLNSFYVRLTLYSHFYNASRLESEIQAAFASAGLKLEAQVRVRRMDRKADSSEVRVLDKELNVLQAKIFAYNRDLLKEVETQRALVYFGRTISYTIDNLSEFSNWDLIKALFVSNVDRHAITRPLINTSVPERTFL
jgi:hypothetical protein